LFPVLVTISYPVHRWQLDHEPLCRPNISTHCRNSLHRPEKISYSITSKSYCTSGLDTPLRILSCSGCHF